MTRNWLVFTVVVVAGWGCMPLEASGKQVVREFSYDGFSEVEIGSAFEFEIVRSESCRVKIEVDEAIAPSLDVQQSGKVLSIGLKPLSGHRHGGELRAWIGLPSLSALRVSGASRGSASGFRSDGRLVLELSGASALKGDLSAGQIEIEASGASNLQLTGTGRSLEIEGSGAADLDLSSFQAQDAKVELSGASDGRVSVTGDLDVDLSGASHLAYRGSPRLGTMETSGASRVDHDTGP